MSSDLRILAARERLRCYERARESLKDAAGCLDHASQWEQQPSLDRQNAVRAIESAMLTCRAEIMGLRSLIEALE